MSKKRMPKWGTCVYCGKHSELTDDHVPPKCFFPTPRPQNTITVPSCRDCNCGRSDNDEYMKNCFVLKDAEYENQNVQQLIPGIIRSLKREEQQFSKNIIEFHIKTEDEGCFKTLGMNVEFSKIRVVCDKIIRGLYYHEFKKPIIEKDVEVESFHENQITNWDKNTTAMVNKVMSSEPHVIKEDVFCYWFETDKMLPEASMWVMRFYGKHYIISFTLPKEKLKQYHNSIKG